MRIIKELWQGKRSLVESYWIWWVIVGGVLSLPLYFFVASASIDDTVGQIVMEYIYMLFFFCVLSLIMVGNWRSAREYKKVRKEKNQGTVWGTVVQVLVVLAVIRLIVTIAQEMGGV